MPVEYYGSEPPPGYVSMGGARWVKADFRIAVIGGGPAGMFCTYILNQRWPQAQVTLFEADNRLGGKIETDRFEDGTPFESGVAELYEYLGTHPDPLRQLIEEDLELRTVEMSGGAVLLGDLILRDLDEVEAQCGKECRSQIEKFHKECAKLMPLAEYANRWQLNNQHPWAKKTFREHLHEEVSDCMARRYIECAVHSDLATESWTCNGLNAIKNVLLDNKRYMQLYHVVGGLEQITERLARRIRADIRLGHRVLSVSPSDKRYSVCYHGLSKMEECFDAVVVCVPNYWLRQIRWEDEELHAAIHAMCCHYDEPAHYLRISMLFDSRWWSKLAMPGEFWTMETCGGLCCYDESARWSTKSGHVLSFLLAGGDALLCCSHNQSDEEIVNAFLKSLPDCMRDSATDELIEAQVDRYVGSINASPGGWPAPQLIPMHTPSPESCPGLFICGDYLFDSTINGALISASTAVDLLMKHFEVEYDWLSAPGWLSQLKPKGNAL